MRCQFNSCRAVPCRAMPRQFNIVQARKKHQQTTDAAAALLYWILASSGFACIVGGTWCAKFGAGAQTPSSTQAIQQSRPKHGIQQYKYHRIGRYEGESRSRLCLCCDKRCNSKQGLQGVTKAGPSSEYRTAANNSHTSTSVLYV